MPNVAMKNLRVTSSTSTDASPASGGSNMRARAPSCLVDGVLGPASVEAAPSAYAVPLVGDVRFCRSAQRLARLTRPELGVGGRGPVTPDGIYQIVAKAGRKAGVALYPHRFRHHFSHTWLDRGGGGGDLMELNGWTSPQMLAWYGGSARGARARRNYDRIMTG